MSIIVENCVFTDNRAGEEWSEWIEHKPGEPCPIPWATRDQCQIRVKSLIEDCERHPRSAAIDAYWGDKTTIKAYRYLLSAAPKLEDQPTAAEIETVTQKPEQDTERDRQQDEAARREIEANAGMLKRDSDGAAPVRLRPIPKRPKITRAGALRLIEDVRRFDREENTSANAFVEWPADHRCGGWRGL